MRKLFRRIHYLIHRGKLERELRNEMAAHLEMMPEDRRPAFGSELRLREDANDSWGWTWLEQLWQDLVYGAHALRRSPGFTFTAVGVLALGIGVNLAEVHILKAALNPPRFADADNIRRLERISKAGKTGGFPMPAVDFYRRYNTVLSDVIVETREGPIVLENDLQQQRSLFVSGNYFTALGVVPSYGRLFDEQDDRPGSAPVAVLSYALWQSRFGADTSVINREIRVNGKLMQIIGVGPYDFSGITTGGAPIWLLMSSHPYVVEGSTHLTSWKPGNNVYGKLKPDVTASDVEAQLSSLTDELRKQQPSHFQPGELIRAVPLDALPRNPKMVAILGSCVLLVLLVLLSACANLGNMLLARGLIRQREIGIRLAIGATSWRIVRQLMTENLLLAGMATVIAVIIGRLFARLTLNLLDSPVHIRLVTDWRLLSAAAACAILSLLAFGLAPAIQTVRPGPRTTRARKVLIAVQMSVSCVLLILGSVLGGGVLRYTAADVSFDYKHMMVIDPALYNHHPSPPVARQTLRDMVSRVSRLPGVDGVGLAVQPPFGIRVPTVRLPQSAQELYLNEVDSAYFSMMRLPIVRGSEFAPAERDGIIVSESAARALWPNEEPLGGILSLFGRTRTVVGVVKDSGANLASFPNSVEVYLPLADHIDSAMLVVHTQGDPVPLLGAANSAASLPGLQSITSSMERDFNMRGLLSKVTGVIVGLLSSVATLLAALGIFGLVAFTVSQRTREIGIRMALGARSPDILRTVLAQYAVPVGAGAVAGAALAAAFCRLAANLVGILQFDISSYVVGLLLFALIAFVASLVPARKALSIQPTAALRHE